MALLCAVLPAVAFQPADVRADSDSEIVARINQYIRQGWADNEVTPSETADDAEFARRASLDIVGRIPTYTELTEFIES
ncbi:MAG: DUF1549 domain-containing protein, partial [Rhodopirellula sp.]|nr:DUF1549 domain-containing protein [Rhodopirellula sp.]